MSQTPKSNHLTILIIVFPLIALLVYSGLTYIFFIYTEQNDIKQELAIYEDTSLEGEYKQLYEKVHALVQFINYYDNQSSDIIKKQVKDIVGVSVDTANNIYHKYKNKKSDNEIKEIILAALNRIKFEGNIGYLFVLDLQGNVMLHIDKKMVGTNILNIQDVYGKYIIKEFNKVLKADGKGFVDYYWYISNEDRETMHYKISYVQMLDCYDWYIGAGEYLKYMKKFVRQDILKYIASNAKFDHGYFFIFDKNEKIIFHPKNIKILNIKPYIHNEFIKNEEQISYTKYIKEYDWYVVAVKNLKSFNKYIINKKKANDLKHFHDIRKNFYFMAITWGISILFSLYLSMIINKLLKNYEKKLQSTHHKLVFQSRQALIGELFSMIAHQWRQPLNKIASIMVMLEFNMQNKKLDQDLLRKKYKEIDDSVEFMSETIDDFRTFYKPKNKIELENLKDLIEQALTFVETSIEKRHIKIIKNLKSVEFVLYKNEFLQVMLNLLKNAIDVLDENGILAIHLYSKKEKIYIEVIDNGLGIDEEIITKVFDPYFTTKEDSSGLGLYMSKIIVEKHMGGTIKVESSKKRTCFIIILNNNISKT